MVALLYFYFLYFPYFLPSSWECSRGYVVWSARHHGRYLNFGHDIYLFSHFVVLVEKEEDAATTASCPSNSSHKGMFLHLLFIWNVKVHCIHQFYNQLSFGPPEILPTDISYDPQRDIIGEGSFGKVYKGKQRITLEITFYLCLKMHYPNIRITENYCISTTSSFHLTARLHHFAFRKFEIHRLSTKYEIS